MSLYTAETAYQSLTPLKEYETDDVAISVFKVKGTAERSFPHPHLHYLLTKARESYRRYGDVPTTDAYDTKAAVYLARATYPVEEKKEGYIEEWLSVRFIPAGGEPVSTEDLDACLYRERPIREWIAERLFPERPDFLRHIVTISRVCHIPPVFLFAEEQASDIVLSQRNRYTGICFALMNQVFFEESDRAGHRYEYVTSMSHPELIAKLFQFKTAQGMMSLPFRKAKELLGIGDNEPVGINRTLLSYQYPGHFLNLHELFSLLQQLVAEGKIVEQQFMRHFREYTSLPLFMRQHRFLSFGELTEGIKYIASALSSKDSIPEFHLSGEELRRLVDKQVSDAVELYLMKKDEWCEGVRTVLREVESAV